MTPEACPSRNGNWLAKMSSFIAEGWMCLCYSVGSERWLCGGLVVMAVMAATAGMSEHRGGGGGGKKKKKVDCDLFSPCTEYRTLRLYHT